MSNNIAVTIVISIFTSIGMLLLKSIKCSLDELVTTSEQYLENVIGDNRQSIYKLASIYDDLTNWDSTELDNIYGMLLTLKPYFDILVQYEPIGDPEISNNLTDFYTTYDDVITDFLKDNWDTTYYCRYINAVSEDFKEATIFICNELQAENAKYNKSIRIVYAVRDFLLAIDKSKEN